MISDKEIARINALYHKSKTQGLTAEEAEEQQRLRRAYIDAVKGNLKGHLDHVHVKHPDGSIRHPDGTWSDAAGNLLDARAAFRTRQRLLRAQIPSDLRERHSQKICRVLEEIISALPADTPVLAYAAIEPEVSLWPLLDSLTAAGRPVYLPVTGEKDLCFYRYHGRSGLAEGRFHIPEPPAEEAEAFSGEEGLVLVPGVAFDDAGNRIGYGRGYYDRFLSAHPLLVPVGVAFPEQIAASVPAEAHDVPMRTVINGEEESSADRA